MFMSGKLMLIFWISSPVTADFSVITTSLAPIKVRGAFDDDPELAGRTQSVTEWNS